MGAWHTKWTLLGASYVEIDHHEYFKSSMKYFKSSMKV